MAIQTSMTLDVVAGFPGQIDGITYHINGEHQVVAGQTIQAGQLVELTAAGYLQPMQQTGATANVFGIAVYNDVKVPNATGATGTSPVIDQAGEYQAGDFVRVLRKGRAYVQWSGSTTAAFDAVPNISHSSTTATAQGKLTDAATSTTAGSEVSVAPVGVRLVRNLSGTLSPGLVLAELNLPG